MKAQDAPVLKLPKKLIEFFLPPDAINEASAREKSIGFFLCLAAKKSA